MNFKDYHKKQCFKRGKRIVHALKCNCKNEDGTSLNYWKSPIGQRILRLAEIKKE